MHRGDRLSATSNGNGKHNGIVLGLSEKLIRVLPPAFIMLVLLNIAFIGVATYVYGHNTDVRNQMLSRIIDTCMVQRNNSGNDNGRIQR